MKRTILASVSAAALIFAAGSAMAQTPSSLITQNGASNNAGVNQTGAAGDTDSTVTQTGANNAVGVTQSGGNNNSTIEQTSVAVGAEAPANVANVAQRGDDGDLTILQNGDNDATVTQEAASDNDDTFVSQDGTDNSASF
jgi:hypothetical protein